MLGSLLAQSPTGAHLFTARHAGWSWHARCVRQLTIRRCARTPTRLIETRWAPNALRDGAHHFLKERKMVEIMTPGEWGTRDGKRAIVWHRPGVAASGESSVVQEVRTYANEVERFEARQRGLDRSSKDSGSSRRRGNQQQGRNPRLVLRPDLISTQGPRLCEVEYGAASLSNSGGAHA